MPRPSSGEFLLLVVQHNQTVEAGLSFHPSSAFRHFGAHGHHIFHHAVYICDLLLHQRLLTLLQQLRFAFGCWVAATTSLSFSQLLHQPLWLCLSVGSIYLQLLQVHNTQQCSPGCAENVTSTILWHFVRSGQKRSYTYDVEKAMTNFATTTSNGPTFRPFTPQFGSSLFAGRRVRVYCLFCSFQ